ncbi:MAG: hypothetical protein QM621_12275 [Aeromicrobium sp.]|uniref:Ig-like domain-containing protein n=1 Tax=Aeromicrobium sp. TaxID=1871063 RepID=UPI0039E66CEF
MVSKYAGVPVLALVVGGAVVAALNVSAEAASTGRASVEDVTSSASDSLDADHVGAVVPDSNGRTSQDFWAGEDFQLAADTSGPTYRTLTGEVDLPTPPPCTTGVVTLTARTTVVKRGGDGHGYVGRLAIGHKDDLERGAEHRMREDTSAVDEPFGLEASTTVSAEEIAADEIVVVVVGETNDADDAISWDLSDFSLDYSWMCPPATVDDKPTLSGDELYTIDPLANDAAETGEASGGVELDPESVGLYNPSASRWTTALTTADGEYEVDGGKVLFTPSEGFGDTVTVPVKYRVTNTDMSAQARKDFPESAYSTAMIAFSTARDAEADTAIAMPGQALTLDVLANDGIDEASRRTLSLLDDGGNRVDRSTGDDGVWTVGDGVLTFTPAEDFAGAATPVSYAVDDQGGVSYTAVVSVVVAAPVADDEVSAPLGDESMTVDPLANDPVSDLDVTKLRLWDAETGQAVEELSLAEGTGSVDPDTGQVSFVLAQAQVGSVTPLRYVVQDAAGAWYSAEIAAEVLPAPGMPALIAGQPAAFGGDLPNAGASAAISTALLASIALSLGVVVLRHRRRLGGGV